MADGKCWRPHGRLKCWRPMADGKCGDHTWQTENAGDPMADGKCWRPHGRRKMLETPWQTENAGDPMADGKCWRPHGRRKMLETPWQTEMLETWQTENAGDPWQRERENVETPWRRKMLETHGRGKMLETPMADGKAETPWQTEKCWRPHGRRKMLETPWQTENAGTPWQTEMLGPHGRRKMLETPGRRKMRRPHGGRKMLTKDFNMENLSKPELRFLLSILEGELEARDLVIEALRARRKEVFVQERYGRFNLGDPFLALQRDCEAGAFDKDKKPICSNPLMILEAVMAHCRKMQERMTAQLAAAERRQRKAKKSQLQAIEQEHKKLLARLEEERAKNKHVVLLLVKECKLLSNKLVEEAQKFDNVVSKLEVEKKKGSELEEALAAEKQIRSQMEAQMEAQVEKQLSEFDTERENLRAKLSQEEAHTKELQDEIDRMKKIIEQLKLSREEDNKANISLLRKNKDRLSLSAGPGSRSVSCQTNLLVIDSDSENVKKSPLTIPAKPSIVNHVIAGNAKVNVCTNSAFAKSATDRHIVQNDSLAGLPSNHGVSSNFSRTEENGCSSEQTNTSIHPNIPFCSTPASPSYLSQSMQSLHSTSSNTTINSGLSPRIQAAKFKFQANANEHDQNGNNTQNPQARESSPNNRENIVAKQMARNTVTQVLSRFTSPQGNTQLRPGFSHAMETGTYPPVAGRTGHPSLALKSTSVSRVDRGNPPPIPPKKPGLSQTPSVPHPPLKTPANVGVKSEHKPITSAPSTSTHGFRVNEETVSKSSPQLPPKPSIDIPVASAGCVIPAIGTSQVGAWPSQSPGWTEPACSESSLVIPTTIACNSSIHPVSASSCRPCDSDSLLVTASGWSPSLTSLLTSGGPVPLADRSTLLHQAAAQGNVTLLSMLLNEEGLDINNLSKDGHTALYSAAANGHTDCVKLLLTSGARVDATVSNGFTALCTAAAQGHSKCAEKLLAYNADINYVGGGQTPLYLACKNGNCETVKLLLDFGANRNITTNTGWTPIHAAADSGNTDCLKLLVYYGGHGDSNKEFDVRLYDIKNKYNSNLEPVISATLINSVDSEGWTAAHIVASKGFKDCLEILCCHSGLEPEKKDKCNRTVHDVATDDCKQLLENLTAVEQLLLNHFRFIMSDGWKTKDAWTFNNFRIQPWTWHNADLHASRLNNHIYLQGPEGSLRNEVDQLSHCIKHKEEATGKLPICEGTPEAFIGPQPFMSCPIVPGNLHIMVKWMYKLWNAVIVPKVQEAILAIATSKRPSVLRHVTATKTQAKVNNQVKAALSILSNKAILHGCPVPKMTDFKEFLFLSMSSTYKSGGKRKEEMEPGEKCLHIEQRLSACSDDEADLVKELSSMCSSKSEPDITKVMKRKQTSYTLLLCF
ncbi:hypothetical protein GDO81_010213 [Engystomops pustulosus]|uniref:Cortactin-binding protein 2 n=1 Tax=Engystomops pustulosus TaxID=76066 RepID=A0AAV7BZ46_ENGPU|nr:hypothetical protein GDO81_010213 [Engystomops pustulosus]